MFYELLLHVCDTLIVLTQLLSRLTLLGVLVAEAGQASVVTQYVGVATSAWQNKL